MQFIQEMGENNALLQRRKNILRDLMYATAAVYQTSFTQEDQRVYATFEIVSFLGWKFHESQQKPKKRGSAQYTLKDFHQELEKAQEESGEKSKPMVYGEIVVSESDDEKKGKSKDEEDESNEPKK